MPKAQKLREQSRYKKDGCFSIHKCFSLSKKRFYVTQLFCLSRSCKFLAQECALSFITLIHDFAPKKASMMM